MARPKSHHLFRRDPVFHPQNSDLTDVKPMPAMEKKKEQGMQRARRQLPERALQPTVRVSTQLAAQALASHASYR